MPCYSPLSAWQLEGGDIVFAERGKVLRSLTLPCGQCIGCRLERSRQWAVRCVHESQLHDANCFVTLTFDDDHLPARSSLNYNDFRLFMRRLRKHVKPIKIRFYMCGEYGENFGRPHFHACIFGYNFPDRIYWRSLPSGSKLYRSDALASLWPFGYTSIGDVTFESAAYVARYIVGKITGPEADSHYTRIDFDTGELYKITPEFTRMSLKPGIGANWFQRYRTDVFSDSGARDYVVIRGRKMKPPRYYDNLLKSAQDFTSDYIEFNRTQSAMGRSERDTPERLLVREQVARARLDFKKRSL